MGFTFVVLLLFVALLLIGLRWRQALIISLLGLLFFGMFRFAVGMLLRSVTGILLIGVVVYLIYRFASARPSGGRKR